MAVKVGTTDIKSIHLGGTGLWRVLVGTTQVWAGATAWTPANLGAQLATWLDASDTATITASGGVVSQWNDKSGNNRHYSQATTGFRPITGTRTIYGRNVLDFDGVDDNLSSSLAGPAQPCTVAAVVWPDTVVAGVVRIHGRQATNAFNLGRSGAAWYYAAGSGKTGGTVTTTAPHTVVGCFADTASRLRADGIQLHDGSAASPGTGGLTATPLAVGALAAGTNAFDGAIAEIVITSTNLNGTADLTSLESYLRAKWGTP